jgi:hypothetical protein
MKTNWFSTKEPKTWWRKVSPFNKCCWENWISTCRRLKILVFHPIPKSTQSGSKILI